MPQGDNRTTGPDRGQLLSRLRDAGVSGRTSRALMQVPREQFIPPEYSQFAWLDESLPIGDGQTISQPSLVGRMIDHLQARPGDTVLDIGTGSGYQAAVLSLLVRDVVTVERVPELCRAASVRLRRLGYSNVSVFDADEELGWPELSPYAGIIVGAASPGVPNELVDQLDDGGRLVIPVGDRERQVVVVVERTRTGTQITRHEVVRFVPLIGKGAW